MKPEIKERWIKALRSGEYSQAKGCLQNDEGFCCLGVLCDLYAKEHPGEFNWSHSESTKTYYFGTNSQYPTENVVEWAELDDECVEVMKEGYSVEVATLNDSNYTFEQIADLIEESL